jgi:hypothetical protein
MSACVKTATPARAPVKTSNTVTSHNQSQPNPLAFYLVGIPTAHLDNNHSITSPVGTPDT